MRVAVIIQNFFPFIGGAEKQALEQASVAVEKGVDVRVLTRAVPGQPNSEVIRNVNVLRLASFGPDPFNAFVFAVSLTIHLLFNLDRYDVYHVHLASSHSLPAALLGRLFRKRVIIKLGGGFQIGELALSRKSPMGRVKLQLLAWADPVFIAVNEGQLAELRASGLGASHVVSIPNGVNLKTFRPSTVEQKNALRAKLKWQGMIFLFVGRFASDKLRTDIFERFIDAWSKTAASQNTFFYLVGQGPLQHDYETIIERYHVENSVKILGPNNDVVDVYRAANVFVLPSISEGLSNALLEAMACGLPVVGSRVPGVVDIVTESEHAYLFDPMETAQIERALRSALGNVDLLSEMGARCADHVRTYSVDATVDRLIALYHAMEKS